MCVRAGEQSRGNDDSTSATTRAVSEAAYALGGEGAGLRSVARLGREARAVPYMKQYKSPSAVLLLY